MRVKLSIASGLILFCMGLASWAQAVPAYFTQQLSAPAGAKSLGDPTAICTDRRTGETIVTDAEGGRVLIFDRDGNYVFEFSNPERISGAFGIAVDSLGRIYVLNSGREKKLNVFDYEGTYLRDVPLTSSSGAAIVPGSLVIDESDNLFASTVEPPHVWIFRTDGALHGDFPILGYLDAELKDQPILGQIALVNGEIVIPLPMVPEIACYTRQGKFLRAFGIDGGGPGELSFPISAASDGRGGVLVLDKHRNTILLYDAEGNFVREFGGMGAGPGWFYHPTSLAATQSGQCVVLQSFQGRIQVVSSVSEVLSVDDTSIAAGSSVEKQQPAAPIKK